MARHLLGGHGGGNGNDIVHGADVEHKADAQSGKRLVEAAASSLGAEEAEDNDSHADAGCDVEAEENNARTAAALGVEAEEDSDSRSDAGCDVEAEENNARTDAAPGIEAEEDDSHTAAAANGIAAAAVAPVNRRRT